MALHTVNLPEFLAQTYEDFLRNEKPAERKATGAYYTPTPIVDSVIRQTLGPIVEGKTPDQIAKLALLDPACGCGAFLLGACRFLKEAVSPRRIENCIHGVELDGRAVARARNGLGWQLQPAEGAAGKTVLLKDNIHHGNALVGPDFLRGRDAKRIKTIDWPTRFPAIMKRGGFDAVVGNPPWGQKRIEITPGLKEYLRSRFPSSAGIFDLFRPFVELAIHLLAPGGRFGMVLPDIVLLKDYPQTRRYLLDHLALERIDCWGTAFEGAVIDVVSIVGSKRLAPANQQVIVTPDPTVPHKTCTIPQSDFLANPRHVFNLHLTSAKREILDRVAHLPRFGDYYEIHEGVHSGNMRAELFVDEAVDESCRPLLLGRDEITPYRLNWAGRFVRLGVVPARRTSKKYANLGRTQWHEGVKILVRRTGDRVLAAVDREKRWAANNFFLAFPRRECALDLDGVCALLNSRFMTWYFRTIEPRKGKAFAELKIKHLSVFPLPLADAAGCVKLNRLGKRRVSEAKLDGEIDASVNELFGLGATSLVE